MPFFTDNHTPKTRAAFSSEVERGRGRAPEAGQGGMPQAEVAGYLAEMIGELALLASARRLDNVACLLNMARIEALIAERQER